MSIRQTVDDINKEIDSLQKDRELLQKICKHKEKIVPYSWRIGAIEDAYICERCDLFIEYVAQRKHRESINI